MRKKKPGEIQTPSEEERMRAIHEEERDQRIRDRLSKINSRAPDCWRRTTQSDLEDHKETCPACGKAGLTTIKNQIQYEESGLPYVILLNIYTKSCSECGNSLVSIPNVTGLHNFLAIALIEKAGRLKPVEITFLRKVLGWNKADFAGKFHVQPNQVSRWECQSNPMRMSKANELLLRTMVAMNQWKNGYLDALENIPIEQELETFGPLVMEFGPGGWDLAKTVQKIDKRK